MIHFWLTFLFNYYSVKSSHNRQVPLISQCSTKATCYVMREDNVLFYGQWQIAGGKLQMVITTCDLPPFVKHTA